MDKTDKKKNDVSMTILTADCDRTFIVAEDKAEKFKNQKKNLKVFQKIYATAAKLHLRNL